MSDANEIIELNQRIDALQREVERHIDFCTELLQFLTLNNTVTNYQALLLIEGGISRDPAVVNQFDGIGRKKWLDAKQKLMQE